MLVPAIFPEASASATLKKAAPVEKS